MLGPYKWIIAGVVIFSMAGSFFAYGAHKYAMGETVGRNAATVEYNAMITTQKLQAAKVLADAVAKNNKLISDLNKLKATQEVQDEKNKSTVATQKRRIDGLVDQLGRLRDPHAQVARCGDGSNPTVFDPSGTTGDSPGNGAYAPGLLSVEFSRLFRGHDELCDDINNAFASCKAYAIKARELLNGQCSDGVM